MKVLQGKKIILGVCGGIAAYKAADLCRLLVKEGAEVQVLMTRAAREFIAPLTFSVLSGRPCLSEMFGEEGVNPLLHIEVAQGADLLLIAPATANIIAKLAWGLADDLLTTTALAVTCPAILAPAMNVNMYNNPAVQENLDILKRRGWGIVEPEEGELACGVKGKGRLASLEKIVAYARKALFPQDLAGKVFLITAGGTREPLDPVRFISNRSSGKMGHALAQAAWERGARVLLVSAAQGIEPPWGVEYYPVETAADMAEKVLSLFPEADVVIKAAAVADFRPAEVAGEKIKKGDYKSFVLTLEPTVDILAELGKSKRHQILVGFAAETREPLNEGALKMKAKNVDLMVVNDVTLEGAGFGSDTNIVTLLRPDGRKEELPRLPKLEVAHRILNAVKELPRFKEKAEILTQKE
ncbi:MAG: bifunctional phosphopantothenoylcysteine decarboxylase/phosphopantothenate--cysteine ligase CoaBC [Thermanaeromonas sp.]|uniref:bifunctional phosphopantothenoylcysteine decarboxylase/phosphopantothenate--cysteine ligase CoaBC n=1 Tax=Thermanaeromonas sp. TaxID=2003697 RepID=UPI00243F167A|nr:bifunctional phosphopantothenoylcysteine decarboxylase/phosphopantothenate--cysteine ligase CoaBC [Thermanaeromonas sp.]MCG0276939.1 bifunctional phosphopantothenoylcysteine decarboxylase/phosphopantothenate--cysteine ligase CoaBC [Thermanaeromonas sp.]